MIHGEYRNTIIVDDVYAPFIKERESMTLLSSYIKAIQRGKTKFKGYLVEKKIYKRDQICESFNTIRISFFCFYSFDQSSST
jgi:hypothetical protein